jgi:uncharacterized protein YdiU (UPF0061 family)
MGMRCYGHQMAALGVPTTRAINLILTDREVYRDDAPSGELLSELTYQTASSRNM